MRVAGLWRYPVKSMLGEPLSTITIDARGVDGDRRFAIVDRSGRAGSAKQVDALFGFSARTREGGVEIIFPDGNALAASDPRVHGALSRHLGADVRLEKGDAAHVDDSPVHVLTTASLAWLRRRLPGAAIDERRFRPNIVLEAQGEALLEQAWLGRTISIGEVRLRVTHPTERCVMTTLVQADLPADPRVLRTLGDEAGSCFGVYAEVVQPGKASIGDPAF
ncbi:MAG: MOSC domain-containing protein [Betaproteobacteria bacterium]